MKKTSIIVILVGITGILLGFFVRGYIIYNPIGSSVHAWSVTHHYEDLFTIDDIVAVNKLVDDWVSKNEGRMAHEATVVVIPVDGNSAETRWRRLSDDQIDEVTSIVDNYLKEVVDKKLFKQPK